MALDPENDETVAMGATQPSTARPAHPTQRFAPGTLLASRYRIVSRLGRGGMGEVFRADDIMLGQQVALKFLPENAGRNIQLLTRFYDEVRIARQISHANVCRVYDIGEIEGQPYLSMEYIDGEDLSSLLRRIGRLPGDKAAEFARKMCAGLAAAHAQGVLHRDIKPGNIMIDGRGEPRITDFGLAAMAASIDGAEIRNGTPAYMAPEQLEGREVTVQSDLYALGLVFHEMFTGKAAHAADTVAELTRMRKGSRDTKASTLVGDLDPAVERAIHACLDPDPKLRPKSALDLARMLPGGDPLAAALAAGQTPSPELVAASGSTGALSPKVGLAIFAATILGLILNVFLLPNDQSANKFPLQNSPDVLVSKAREILKGLSYTAPAADFASGYSREEAQLRFLQKKISGPDQWDDVLAQHPTALLFWYRESPLPLHPYALTGGGRASLTNPEMNIAGMTELVVGLDGELVQFNAVPPPISKREGTPPTVEWAKLFAFAHLDPDKFQPADPEWTPLAATDSRVAWTGLQPTTYKQPVEIPIRVEAASFHGRPVYFQVIYPWTESPRVSTPAPEPATRKIGQMIFYGVVIILIMGSLFLARRHVKTGSGDVRGAVRVGACVGALTLTSMFLGGHVSDIDFELDTAQAFAAASLYFAAMLAVFYLALEPWVRKSWPRVLITWSRILQGHWTDPMVGRDALLGVGLGVLFDLLFQSGSRFLLRTPDSLPRGNFQIRYLDGVNRLLAGLISSLNSAIVVIIALLLLLFFLRILLRKEWLAAVVLTVVGAFVQAQGESVPLHLMLPFDIVVYGLVVVSMLRLGAFATIVMIFVSNSMGDSMLTTDFTAWYGKSSWIWLAICAGIALWGYRVAVAGQSLLDERES